MNPKPGWVRNMKNIYAMLKRVDFLNEVRESERIKAAETLHNELCAFVAHYGYACTEECPYTCLTYTLLREGLILRKKEEDDAGKPLRWETSPLQRWSLSMGSWLSVSTMTPNT